MSTTNATTTLLLVLSLIFVVVLGLLFFYVRWRAFNDRRNAWQESERGALVDFSPEVKRRWGRRASDIPDVKRPR